MAGNFSKSIEILSLAALIEPEHAAIKKMINETSDKFLQKIVKKLESDVLAGDDEILLNHIEFLIKSNKLEDAAKKLADTKLSARGWLLKGELSYRYGSLKQSRIEFAMALEIDSTMTEAITLTQNASKLVELIEGATEQMSLKNNAIAVEMLTKALEVDDSNKRIAQAIYFQRAMCKLNMGQKHEAFDDYLLFESLQNQTGMIMEGIKF